jgi:hypothetical protein
VTTVEVNFEFNVVLEKVIEVAASAMPVVFSHHWFLELGVVSKFKRQVDDLEVALASKIYQEEPLSRQHKLPDSHLLFCLAKPIAEFNVAALETELVALLS